MAGVRLGFRSGAIAMANNKTIYQIVAAANHRAVVKGFGVSIAGTSATDAPVQIDVLRQTTAGTMTAGTTGTHISKKDSSDSETVQTTVQTNATAEPTSSDLIDSFFVHPQTGVRVFFPFAEEVHIPGGGRLGFRTVTALTYNIIVDGDCEE